MNLAQWFSTHWNVLHHPAYYEWSIFASDWTIAALVVLLPRMLERLGYYDGRYKSARRIGAWINGLLGLHFFLIPLLGVFHAWQFRIFIDFTLALFLVVAAINIAAIRRVRIEP